ncbi:hypothetical protein LXL04_010993 [Taraxacum kok-saghyz]
MQSLQIVSKQARIISKQQRPTLMANTIRSKALLIIFIMFVFLCASSYANQEAQNGDSSQLFLRKLGLKVSDLEYYKRRSLVNPGRVAPGGPDGQHHFSQAPLAH